MNYFSLFILLWIPYSWAKPIVKHPTVMYDIAIIGAGISGLYCGWRLIPDTKKIIILEQDNRVGGRIWSVPIPKIDAFKAEIGAMRFLSTHYLLMNLLQELQIPIQDFKHTYFKDNPLFVRDTHLQAQDVYQKKAPLPYKISKQYQGKSADQIITDIIESYIPHAQEKTPDQWNELRKTITIDNVPLYKHGFWNLLLKKIRMEDYHYIQETQGFSTIISNWNGAEAFAWFSREFQPNQQYHTLKPGMSELPEKLAHAFEKEGGTLKLSHSVEKISLDHTKKNSYYVLSIKDSSQKIYAKKLILALPKRAIQIVQEKSPLLQQAQFTQDLASVEAERGSKLYLAYDWPWWTDLGLTYGNGITDLPLRQFFYFNHQKPLTKKKNNPSLLMAGYNDGTSVDFWNGFTQPSDPPLFAPKLLIDEAQRQLKKIHQYSIPQPYYAIFHDWVNDPYGGAWHFWNPGIKTWEVMPRIQQPFAKQALYICGEAYSVTQGWIEGALETAELLLKEKFGLKPPAWLSKKSATC